MVDVFVQELSKSFGRIRALDRVSFRIPSGSFSLLVGPNGAGKSTLLSCIAGLFHAERGEICFQAGGARTPVTPDTFRTRIGYAARTPLFYGDLTVRENFKLHFACAGRSEESLQMNAELRRYGLESSGDKRLSECSTGVRQRVALLRAFAFDPALLVLDEPFSNLDSSGKELLLKDLQVAHSRGVTVVLASHEEELVKSLVDIRLELNDGMLTDITSVDDLRRANG